MGNHYIYSYRLTYFGGTAPCYDGDFLSLAICKRDMRRMIGRNYNFDRKSNKDNTYWFIGIVGSTLAKDKDSDFKGCAGNILYVAKVTDVKDFSEYFSNPAYKNRQDQIYEESPDGQYHTDGCDKYFKHNGVKVHDDNIMLQERDWDVQHGSRENYVLISDRYSFIDDDSSIQIVNALNDDEKLAKGVGHSWFETDETSDLVKCLNKIIENQNDHGKRHLPKSIRTGSSGGCGKDKA